MIIMSIGIHIVVMELLFSDIEFSEDNKEQLKHVVAGALIGMGFLGITAAVIAALIGIALIIIGSWK